MGAQVSKKNWEKEKVHTQSSNGGVQKGKKWWWSKNDVKEWKRPPNESGKWKGKTYKGEKAQLPLKKELGKEREILKEMETPVPFFRGEEPPNEIEEIGVGKELCLPLEWNQTWTPNPRK